MDSCSNEHKSVRHLTGFAQYVGLRITKLENGRAEGEMPIVPEVLNPHGNVHGGCLVTLADTVAGSAAHSVGSISCVTLSSTFNYLRPGTGSMLYCRAEPQKIGRTVSVYDVFITDDQDRLVATGCFSFFYTGRPISDWDKSARG